MVVQSFEDRLTEIKSKLADGKFSYGSGFLLGDGLILTARHVLVPDGWPADAKVLITARPRCAAKAGGTWLDADLAWPSSEELAQGKNSDLPDVALIRLRSFSYEVRGDEPLFGLGNAVGDVIRVSAVGFPAFAAFGERADQRDSNQIAGVLNRYSGLVSGTYEIEQLELGKRNCSAASGRPDWQGFSGAALFAQANRRLIGVVVTHNENGRFEFRAVRVDHLFQKRPDFAAAIRGVQLAVCYVTTLAGSPSPDSNEGWTDGTGAAARFNLPHGIAVDASSTLYVVDTNNKTIRKVTPSGEVTTLAAKFTTGAELALGALAAAAAATRAADSRSAINTLGARIGAKWGFRIPHGIAVDSTGTLYVVDTDNHTIRKVTPSGEVTTLAGSAGNAGSDDGTGSAARFRMPHGIAVDASGTLYVVDTDNHTIRKVTPSGEVTTLVGSAGNPGSRDGTGSAARFNAPRGIAVDASGTLYVVDTNNHTIRKVTPPAMVTTLAGSPKNAGFTDGTGPAARFNMPHGITVDANGILYVVDTHNHTIRKVTPSGAVTTLAGLAGKSGSADGIGTVARFNAPRGIAVDARNTIYVSDSENHSIRKIDEIID